MASDDNPDGSWFQRLVYGRRPRHASFPMYKVPFSSREGIYYYILLHPQIYSGCRGAISPIRLQRLQPQVYSTEEIKVGLRFS